MFGAGIKESLQDSVIRIAKSYLGQQEEKNNSGFKDPAFLEKMKSVGWNKGESWCAYTAELIWKEAFGEDHPLYAAINKLFSASAIATFANFSHSDLFKTGKVPQPGAVAIWRHGNTWQGHAGIVVNVWKDEKHFETVEGNTNSQGGREGIEVAQKIRTLGDLFSIKGLNLEGFIYLPE